MIRPHPFSLRAGPRQAHLRIMETTDLHVHIHPYNYYSDRADDTVGLARTASLVSAIRDEATNAVLFDNGDFLQGNPMGDYIAHERGMREGDLHPVIEAMNTIGFDASTLGNHEFNYGLDFLMKSIAGAAFPFVSANVVRRRGARPTDDTPLIPPYVILDRDLKTGAGDTQPIRIGVIGFVPPQIMNWDRRLLERQVEVRDILEAAGAWVPRMREDGADIIIALSHSGIGSAQHTDGMENASVPLAAVAGIDALLTGHAHLLFPSPAFRSGPVVDAVAGTLHGKPATMGGYWGSHLGLVDLLLEHDGGDWHVATHAVSTRPIYALGPDRTVRPTVDSDPHVLRSARQAHEDTLRFVRRPVGRTSAPLHSYFALVANDPSVQVVAAAQAWYMREMLSNTAHGALPLLSAAAPYKAGGRGGPMHYTDVPAGDLSIRNAADLYFYPNTIRAVLVTGAELRAWLDRSAALFRQIPHGGRDALLHDPDFPSYNFDVISGIRYTIDLSTPARFDPHGRELRPGRSRIASLTWRDEPVTDDRTFVVATNSYRASGGGYFPGAIHDRIVFEGTDTNRDILVRYIAEQGIIKPTTAPIWSFEPMPGTTAIFRSGPRAAAHLSSLNRSDLSPTGLDEDGFARFRIKL